VKRQYENLHDGEIMFAQLKTIYNAVCHVVTV